MKIRINFARTGGSRLELEPNFKNRIHRGRCSVNAASGTPLFVIIYNVQLENVSTSIVIFVLAPVRKPFADCISKQLELPMTGIVFLFLFHLITLMYADNASSQQRHAKQRMISRHDIIDIPEMKKV